MIKGLKALLRYETYIKILDIKDRIRKLMCKIELTNAEKCKKNKSGEMIRVTLR